MSFPPALANASFAVPQTNSDMGLVCVITNKKGIKSHAFGTFHYSDQETVQKSYFHQIIDNCSCLYTELGELSVVGFDWADRQEYSDLTYRWNLDTAITCAAEDRNIIAISLDADVPEEAETMRQISENRELYGEEMLIEGFMERAKQTANNPLDIALHNSIKKGDQSILLKIKQVAKNSPTLVQNANREEHWANRLIPELNNTDTPVCIAVGALHLVGEGGLADRFKKAGLKVEFIQHQAPELSPSGSLISRIAAKLGSFKSQALEGVSLIFKNYHSPNGMKACKGALH